MKRLPPRPIAEGLIHCDELRKVHALVCLKPKKESPAQKGGPSRHGGASSFQSRSLRSIACDGGSPPEVELPVRADADDVNVMKRHIVVEARANVINKREARRQDDVLPERIMEIFRHAGSTSPSRRN